MLKTRAPRRGMRLLSALLAAAMLFSLSIGASAAYPDVPGSHWAGASIERWQDLGVMQGDGHGFRPNSPATRAEVAVVLDRIVGFGPQAVNAYADLPDSAYYTAPMLRLCAAGLLQGNRGQMRPNDPVTRQEMAVIIARLAELEPGGQTAYADGAAVASWARDAVAAVSGKGWFRGSGGSFRPGETITRAELAVALDRCMGLVVTDDAQRSGDLAGVTVVKSGVLKLSGIDVPEVLLIGDGGSAVLSGGHAGTVVLLGGARLTLEKGAAVDLVAAGAGASLSHVTVRASATVKATELRDGALGGRVQRPGTSTGDSGSQPESTVIELSAPGAVLGGGEVRHYDKVTVLASVGDGEVTLRGLTIGELVVQGGGSHSILLEGTAVETVLVDKADGEAPALKLDAASSMDLVGFASGGSVVGLDGKPAVGAVVVTEGQSVALKDVVTTSVVTAGSLTLNGVQAETITVAKGAESAAVTLEDGAQVGLVVVDEDVTAQPTLTCDAGTSLTTLLVNSGAGAALAGEQKPLEVFASSEEAKTSTTGAEATVVEGRLALGLTGAPVGLTVPGGTAFADLELPATLEVRCADNSTAELPVIWSDKGYDPEPLKESTVVVTGALNASGQPDITVTERCKAEIQIEVTVEQPIRTVVITSPDLPDHFSVDKETTLRYTLTAPGLTAGDVTARAATAANVTVGGVTVADGDGSVIVTIKVTGTAEAEAAALTLAHITSVNPAYLLRTDTLGGTFAVTDVEPLAAFTTLTPVLNGSALSFTAALELPLPEGIDFALSYELFRLEGTDLTPVGGAAAISPVPSDSQPYYTLSGDRREITVHAADMLSGLQDAGTYRLKLTAAPTAEGGAYGESSVTLEDIQFIKPTLDGLFRYVCLGDSEKLSRESLEHSGERIHAVSGDVTEFYFGENLPQGIAALQYKSDRDSEWTDCFSAEEQAAITAGTAPVRFIYPKALGPTDDISLRLVDPEAERYAVDGGALTVRDATATHEIFWKKTGNLTTLDIQTPVTQNNSIEADRFSFTTLGLLNGPDLTQADVIQDIYRVVYFAGQSVYLNLVDAEDGVLNTTTNAFAPGKATVTFSKIDQRDTYDVQHIVVTGEPGATVLRPITSGDGKASLQTTFRYDASGGGFDASGISLTGTQAGQTMQVAVTGLPAHYDYFTDAEGAQPLAVTAGGAALKVPCPETGKPGEQSVYAKPQSTRADTLTYPAQTLAFTVQCGGEATGGEAPKYQIEAFESGSRYGEYMNLTLNQALPEGTVITLEKSGAPYQLPVDAQAVSYLDNTIYTGGLLQADATGAEPVALVLTPPAGAAIRDGNTFRFYTEQPSGRLYYYGRAEVPAIDENVVPALSSDSGTVTLTLKAPTSPAQAAAVLCDDYETPIQVVENTITLNTRNLNDGTNKSIFAEAQLAPGKTDAFLGRTAQAAFRLNGQWSSLSLSGYEYEGLETLGIRFSPDGQTASSVVGGRFDMNIDKKDIDALEVKLPGTDSFIRVQTTQTEGDLFWVTPRELGGGRYADLHFAGLEAPATAETYTFRIPGSYQVTENSSTHIREYTVNFGGTDYITLTPAPTPDITNVTMEIRDGWNTDIGQATKVTSATLTWEGVGTAYKPRVTDANGKAYGSTTPYNDNDTYTVSDAYRGVTPLLSDQRVPHALNLLLVPKEAYPSTTGATTINDHIVPIVGSPVSITTQPGGSQIAEVDAALFGTGGMVPAVGNHTMSVSSQAFTKNSLVDIYLGDASTPAWKDLKPAYDEAGKRYYVDLTKESGDFAVGDALYLVASTSEQSYDAAARTYTFAGSSPEIPKPTDSQILKVLAPDEAMAMPVTGRRATEADTDGILFRADAEDRSVTGTVDGGAMKPSGVGTFFLSMEEIAPKSETGAVVFTFSAAPYRKGGAGIRLNAEAGNTVTYTTRTTTPTIASIAAVEPVAGELAPGEQFRITMSETGGEYNYTLFDTDKQEIAAGVDGVLTFDPTAAKKSSGSSAVIQLRSRYGAVDEDAKTITLGGTTKIELREGPMVFPRITDITINEADPRVIDTVHYKLSQTPGEAIYWGRRDAKEYALLTEENGKLAFSVPFDMVNNGYDAIAMSQPEKLGNTAESGAAWTICLPKVTSLQPDVQCGPESANKLRRISLGTSGDTPWYYVELAEDQYRKPPLVWLNGGTYEATYYDDIASRCTRFSIPFTPLDELDGLTSLPSFNEFRIYAACKIDLSALAPLGAIQSATPKLEGTTLTITARGSDVSLTEVLLQIGDRFYSFLSNDPSSSYTFDLKDLDLGALPDTATIWRAPVRPEGTSYVEKSGGFTVDLTGLKEQPAPAPVNGPLEAPESPDGGETPAEGDRTPPPENQTPPDEDQPPLEGA